MLPEDDRMIEICWSVLSVFNVNFRLLKTIYASASFSIKFLKCQIS